MRLLNWSLGKCRAGPNKKKEDAGATGVVATNQNKDRKVVVTDVFHRPFCNAVPTTSPSSTFEVSPNSLTRCPVSRHQATFERISDCPFLEYAGGITE